MDAIDSNKQYSLRWEKHAFNLASEAGCFFEDESFLDCTLSAEGQCIDAHKIILSASSSYLSNLLKIMPDKHPILIFNDIKFEQLKSLVAFIYNGSVNVSENNIHAFLNAAQSLLIKGLSEESNEDDRGVENVKRHANVSDVRTNYRKPSSKVPVVRKPEIYVEASKNLKKPRQIFARGDLRPLEEKEGFAICEESLSKLQEISFTKYIHQNLNSRPHIRNEFPETKWNGPTEEQLKVPENYVVKSWKHNSVEDLNGRHKQNKNNILKKVRLEKPINSSNEESDHVDKSKGPTDQQIHPQVNQNNRSKLDEGEERIKTEIETESVMLVEPKQEFPEEEDTNSEEYETIHNSGNENITPDSDTIYEGRSLSNFYHQPVVDRGVPVPLLMCRTSLSEPESVESNWIPQITPNAATDHHPPQANSTENSSQDLQCRTCAQDLPCPTCTKKYKSRYALNRHILYECGKARKSFSCDECGKKVTRQDTLQKHKLIHLVQHLKRKESEADEEPPKTKKLC